jgi:predicted O-linked N-acetylglucosamine transferase (SPINDLY family)
MSALEQPPPGNIDGSSGQLVIGTGAQVTLYHLDLAERFYKSAIVLRPKYWDATINLAGLLSSQGRWKEALEVYITLERVFETSLDQNDRRPHISPSELPLTDDSFLIQTLQELEYRRQKSPFAYLYIHDGFTKDRRRDLAYAKGNLHLAIGNVLAAKMEYIAGLVAADVDLHSLYLRAKAQTALPQPCVTPQDALATYQQCEQRLLNHAAHTVISSLLQTLAKIYQDHNSLSMAVELYYLSLKIYATPNACNNLGIILAAQRLDESILWYELGLSLDPKHVHLYTNLGSALKDRGRLVEGIASYQRAITLQPDFYIALANLANVFKDLGRIDEALSLYRRALAVKPDFVEAFCNFVNSSLFVCDWSDRDVNLGALKNIVEKQLADGAVSNPPLVPTVLPFHTFTYSNLDAWMIREISRRNADRALWNVLMSDWFPGFPARPADIVRERGLLTEQDKVKCAHYPYPYPVPKLASPLIRIGYLSSDFINHPLAHLMQSVFGMHNRARFRTYTYSLSPTDNSPFRQKIERESDVFMDVSAWTIKQIVEQIAQIDEIHILVNLNGYTKGGRNEIFAARAAPIHVSLMGFAGTMGAGSVNDPDRVPDSRISEDAYFDDIQRRWMDYLVADDIAAPRKFVCGEPLPKDEVEEDLSLSSVRGPIVKLNDANRMYTEGILYMPHTYFVNDHRQGFRESEDVLLENLFASSEYQVTAKEFDEEELTLDECLLWRKEQVRRLKMRKEIFPSISENTVIFANFNQLYKMDPDIFISWMNILKAVPNSILWLLRFPPAGEGNLKKRAIELVGEQVASRLIFTGKSFILQSGRI